MSILATTIYNDIDTLQVLLNIGYASERKPSARVGSLIKEYAGNIRHLIEPSYSYTIRDVILIHGSSVAIDGSVVFESNVVAQLLERCVKVAAFLVTIGSRLEKIVSSLAENGLVLQATVLDAVGSVVVEKTADFVQGKIGQVASAQGLSISRRFSPGYCDWDISQQKMLFEILNSDVTGVHLTKEYLMLPRKSMSGIIGIGRSNIDVKSYNPCQNCNKHDCRGRR